MNRITVSDSVREAWKTCAGLVCPFCAVEDRAGFRLRDLGLGTLHHLTREGHMHECKAVKIRKAAPNGVFEEPSHE